MASSNIGVHIQYIPIQGRQVRHVLPTEEGASGGWDPHRRLDAWIPLASLSLCWRRPATAAYIGSWRLEGIVEKRGLG